MIWVLLFGAIAVGSVSRTSLFQDYLCGAAVVGIPLAIVRGEWGLLLFCVGAVALFIWHWSRTA